MKKIFWLVGGLCAAAAGFLAWGAGRSVPVEDLAHRADPPVDPPLDDAIAAEGTED